MDAKTISEKSKALVKATSTNESAAVIIGILNELKKGVVASEDVLRSTRIGVTVSKAKQHKNPDVSRLANDIVRKWREEVEKQRGSAGKKVTATPPRNTASPAPGQQEKRKSVSTEASSASSVPPDQRSWKKDKVDIARTGSATRDNCVGLIYDGLVYLTTASSSSAISVSVAVEYAAYKKLGPEEKTEYKSKMRSLYQNLKNKANGSLRSQVLSGEISPDRFISMTHDELKSAERKKEDQALEKENMRAAQAPMAEKSVSTALECGKCKQKKVSYSQAQTRSADEPMTTFCECLVCGKRWKFS